MANLKVPSQMELAYPYEVKNRKGLQVVRRAGNLLFMSGTACEDQMDGHPLYTGRIGRDVSVEDGIKGAEACALIHLSLLSEYLGGQLDRVDRFIRAYGILLMDDNCHEADRVFDGYSNVIYAAFGERGRHARLVHCSHNLPNKLASVEIECILSLKPDGVC